VTIVLLTLGTRGDVQPFVALGLRLRERGGRIRSESGTATAVDFMNRFGASI